MAGDRDLQGLIAQNAAEDPTDLCGGPAHGPPSARLPRQCAGLRPILAAFDDLINAARDPGNSHVVVETRLAVFTEILDLTDTIAITQIRADTEGRAYYQRKRAEGKTKREALRCLKRRLSDLVYRTLKADLVDEPSQEQYLVQAA